MTRHLAALTATLLLAACGSSVDLVSADSVAKFTPGKTNETEVVGELGKPLETITEADGSKIEQYAYGPGASGGSMWPDWMGGSGPNAYRMVSFVYGPGGTLKQITGADAK